MKNQKTTTKGIIGTIIIFGLITLVVYSFMKPEKQEKMIVKKQSIKTESFLFDVLPMNIATTKRTVVILNVPITSKITYEQLKKEAEFYAIKVFKDKKPDVLAVNIFWSKEKYKTFKGDTFCGQIVYAPFGDWGNTKPYKQTDYKFNYDAFQKKYFRKK